MEAETVQEAVSSEELKAQLEQTRARLDEITCELRAVDAELDALSIPRKQHRLLQATCESLRELSANGGAGLFWGDGTATDSEECLRRAGSHLGNFRRHVEEVEARRRALYEQVKEQHLHAEYLEDDAFEAQEEEERVRNEWIVEREIDSIRFRALLMPWSRGAEDDRRFRRSLGVALLVSVLLALIVNFIDLPLRVREEPPALVADREVTMEIDPQVMRVPPPVATKPKERVVKQQPNEKPEPRKVPARETQPTDEPGPEQGILAFRDKLEAVKEVPIVASLGARARINSDDSAARPERSMLTTNAPGSSGGIKLAALSRGLGGNGGNERGAIQGAALTRASSSINSIAAAAHPLSGGPGLARTDEEIQIVFDRYKAALYRLYNRELRKDPTLQGKMILRLTIEPGGQVSFCQLQSSDMNAPDLSAQVVDRVRSFDFGAKEVPAITIVYPIDFLPAA
jgi:outer membrane biosynthesis protein TonB